jgi:putative transposase
MVLDEVALTMNKRRYWLWRAVDQDGTALDILVQSRHDQSAAECSLHGVLGAEDGVEPRVVITDKLSSYPRRSGASCRTRSTAATNE